MAKLIKLTEFIHIIGNSTLHESYEDDLCKIYNYTSFLRQEISLSHFIPCDEKGNFLEIPIYNSNEKELEESWLKYREAQLKVIFKGFSIKQNDGWVTLIYKKRYYKSFANFNDKFKGLTIEDYICENLEVTEEIQKQFNL